MTFVWFITRMQSESDEGFHARNQNTINCMQLNEDFILYEKQSSSSTSPFPKEGAVTPSQMNHWCLKPTH
jgi:hypothetical protein